MNINHATPADLPLMLPMVNAAYRGEASKQGWTTEANLIAGDLRTDLQELQRLHAHPGTTFLKVTDAAGTLLGSVLLQHNAEQGLYLGMLSVWPAGQGMGVGKRLMQGAEEHARSLGCDRIYMTVITARTELIAWYQKLGYTDTGERKPFEVNAPYGIPTQPLEFMVLEKWLS